MILQRLLRRSLTFFGAFVLASCASGSALVTGTRRPAISVDQVTLYLEPPANFEVIGLVNASSDAGWTEQGSLDYAIKELKKQAAKIGANGVLITTTGETTSTMVIGQGATAYGIPVSAKHVQGRAIFVQKP